MSASKGADVSVFVVALCDGDVCVSRDFVLCQVGSMNSSLTYVRFRHIIIGRGNHYG